MTLGSGPGTEGRREAIDRDAVIFREVYPSLRRWAAVVSTPTTDPDDLVQEAVVRTLRRRQLADLDHPAAYLRTAILNLAKNAHRSRIDVVAAVESEPASDRYPSDLSVLDALTDSERIACFLVDVEGYTSREAADVIGARSTTIKARAARGRRKLKAALAAEGRNLT